MRGVPRASGPLLEQHAEQPDGGAQDKEAGVRRSDPPFPPPFSSEKYKSL